MVMQEKETKYKLIGYQPVGFEYNIPRTEIAVNRNGNWYKGGRNKELCNFVIQQIIE